MFFLYKKQFEKQVVMQKQSLVKLDYTKIEIESQRNPILTPTLLPLC